MAQSSQNPTIAVTLGGDRQQVPLRDYLNQRVAPFLKKAIHESLEAEPEFPLQWLGEHLIHQSILYEQNPDRTGILERFAYKHDAPVPAPSMAAAPTAVDSATPAPDHDLSSTAPPATLEPIHSSEAITNGRAMNHDEASQNGQGPGHINGETREEIKQEPEPSQDTDMGGTS